MANGCGAKVVAGKRKKRNQLKTSYAFDCLVPRAGIEPARIAPLVFETSASTDSAIWACALYSSGAKIEIFYRVASLRQSKIGDFATF